MCRVILMFSSEFSTKKVKQMSAFQNGDYDVVYETGNGKDALAYLQNNHVDAIFTGTRLFDMDILDFLQKLHQKNHKENVILIDSCQDLSQALTYIRHGAFDYLISPVAEEQLAKVTRRLKEVSFLSAQAFHPLLSNNNYALIYQQLLNGNENFLLYIEQLFHKAEQNRHLKLSDMQTGFQYVLQRFWIDVENVYPFLPLYFSKSDFDILSQTSFSNSSELLRYIQKLSTELFDLVTLFKPTTNSQLILKVTDFVWNNVENEITLAQIAESLYVNKSYLSHLFRAETGRTFVDYFTEIRMLRSRQLLKNHYRVYECALALGYKDSEYFSKVFKNHFGYKPTEYIARAEQIPYTDQNLLLEGECL